MHSINLFFSELQAAMNGRGWWWLQASGDILGHNGPVFLPVSEGSEPWQGTVAFVINDPVQTSVFPASKWQCKLTLTLFLSPLSAVRCKMEDEEVPAASMPLS